MDQPNCVFCKIVRGEIPSERVFDDGQVMAFLDINPIAPGHTLLIPHAHSENLLDTPPEVLAALLKVAPRVARAAMAAVGAEGFNFFQFNGSCSGQDVFHLHFHIIPRRPGDGVRYQWRQGKYAAGEIAALGMKIRGAIPG